jgi:hypothetical protein
MSEQDEIDRIRQIREEQIRARDPRKKDAKFYQKVSTRPTYDEVTWEEILKDIPIKWWGTILGGVIGLIVGLVLNMMVEASWAQLALPVTTLAGVAMGRGLGMAMDWSEEDHDKLVGR